MQHVERCYDDFKLNLERLGSGFSVLLKFGGFTEHFRMNFRFHTVLPSLFTTFLRSQ